MGFRSKFSLDKSFRSAPSKVIPQSKRRARQGKRSLDSTVRLEIPF